MFLAITILLVLAVSILDVPTLIRQRAYKDLAVFTAFLLAGIYVAMVQLYDWPFYNPLLVIAARLHGP